MKPLPIRCPNPICNQWMPSALFCCSICGMWLPSGIPSRDVRIAESLRYKKYVAARTVAGFALAYFMRALVGGAIGTFLVGIPMTLQWPSWNQPRAIRLLPMATGIAVSLVFSERARRKGCIWSYPPPEGYRGIQRADIQHGDP